MRRVLVAFRGMQSRYTEMVVPDANGLPRLRVLFTLPLLLAVVAAVLISVGINGSSSGAYYSLVGSGDDPDLIAGHPQSIRSDEWNTGTAWTIAQAEQGFPVTNGSFPGGMDAALPYDLPRLDWSVGFRPHLIGYLLLDVDHGTAWRWWMCGLSLIAAAYVFIVSVLPRRPLTAAILSVAFYFSPFFQWWYQSATFWPVSWALVTMASFVWASRSRGWKSRAIWSAVVCYLTVVMAMGIYVPYIASIAYVVTFFGLGLVVRLLRTNMGWREVVARFWPTLAAAGVAGAIMALFLAERSATLTAFLSTVYPGERLVPTGSGGPRALLTAFASPYTEALDRTGGFLGSNSSEASTFFFVGLFLLPAIVFSIARIRRSHHEIPWELVGLVGVCVLFAAFAVVPGWDAIAHALFLDRILIERLRIGLGLASFAMVVYLIRCYDDFPDIRPGRVLSAAGALVFLAIQAAAGYLASKGDLAMLTGTAPFWWFLAPASGIVLYLLARGRLVLAVVGLAVVVVPASFIVNPIYIGVLDLRETELSTAIMESNSDHGGSWIGIGGPIVTATLQESGVTSYNGVQGAPSRAMWSSIDPHERYADLWNRIGYVNWKQGRGEPEVTNPGVDQVVVTFDACSEFAQENVSHVLSESRITDPCLEVERSVSMEASTFVIYSVIRPR